MSTTIRPEISKKNRYWIEKHRYYELKHFCLQYPTWKKAYSSLDSMVRFAFDAVNSGRTNKIKRPVEDTVIAREYYSELIGIVEDTAKETDEDLGTYILKDRFCWCWLQNPTKKEVSSDYFAYVADDGLADCSRADGDDGVLPVILLR